jgi:hypothetical protein
VGGYIGFILDILTLSFFGLESDKDFQGWIEECRQIKQN